MEKILFLGALVSTLVVLSVGMEDPRSYAADLPNPDAYIAMGIDETDLKERKVRIEDNRENEEMKYDAKNLNKDKQISQYFDKCLFDAERYTIQNLRKLVNMNRQINRIERWLRISQTKALKKNTFDPVHFKLLSIGGGSDSSLNCLGEKDTDGATELRALANGLANCPRLIEEACVTAQPSINQKEIEDCRSKAGNFSNAWQNCSDLFDNDVKCRCFSNLEAASSELRSCDFSKLVDTATRYKESCRKRFFTCKKLEDFASDAIFKCSRNNQPSLLLCQLKRATTNLNALIKLQDSATALLNGTARNEVTRRFRQASLSCNMFSIEIESIYTILTVNPYNHTVATQAKDLVNIKPVSCPADSIPVLAAATQKIDAGMEALESYIKVIQATLAVVTGSTASEQLIADTPSKHIFLP